MTRRIKKFASIIQQRGITSTIHRLLEQIWHRSPHWKFILYYYDTCDEIKDFPIPAEIALKSFSRQQDIGAHDYKKLCDLAGETSVNAYMPERFTKGGTFWLLKQNDAVLSFIWTFRGVSYDSLIPVAANDVYCVDGGCFPEHRGKGYFAYLFTLLIPALGCEGVRRMYWATRTWNRAMISCAKRTPYRPIAILSAFSLWGKPWVIWHALTDLSGVLWK